MQQDDRANGIWGTLLPHHKRMTIDFYGVLPKRRPLMAVLCSA